MEENYYEDDDALFFIDLDGYDNFDEFPLKYHFHDDDDDHHHHNNNNNKNNVQNKIDDFDTIDGFMELNDQSMNNLFSAEVKFKSAGNLAQRRAAKLGFDDSRIHGTQLKTDHSPFSSLTSSSSSSSLSSSFLTIPSGISPTALLDSALLDSPVMLHNAQLSPTTGTLPLEYFNHDPLPVKSTDISRTEKADEKKDNGSKSDAPFLFSSPPTSNLTTQIQANINNHQYPKFQADYMKRSRSPESKVDGIQDGRSTTDDHHLDRENVDGNKKACTASRKGKNKVIKTFDAEAAKDLDDGYYWRKYGQKMVKGSMFPRSYYRCNGSECVAKKKVGKSLDGAIVEIIYKGDHNHPQPKEARGCQAITISDGWNEGFANQIATIGLENSEYVFGRPFENCELSYENGYGARLVGNDESDRERRKIEISDMTSRSGRDQRILLRMISEVDVVDDGYRWRKYGQKVVKGNQFPRSYYKCTTPGCPVRKHVERESGDNNRYVITTYEGKHNHEVPTAKNNATTTTSSSRTNLAGAGNGGSNLNLPHHHPILGIPKNPNHHHPHPHHLHNHNMLPNQEFKPQELSLHYQHHQQQQQQQQQMMIPYSSPLYEMMKHPAPPPPNPPPYMINPNPNPNPNPSSSCPTVDHHRYRPFMPLENLSLITMQAPLSITRSASPRLMNSSSAAASSSIYNNGIFSWMATNSSSSAAQPQTSVGNELHLIHENNNDLRFFRPKEEQ